MNSGQERGSERERARERVVGRERRTDLVLGGVVDLGRQALSLGLAGEQVLGLVQTQAEDLGVQVVVLIPQLKVLLRLGINRRV